LLNFKILIEIYAVETVYQLVEAVPKLLPSFTVLQKKLRVLLEAATFVVDPTGESLNEFLKFF
jgi:hypothetical protein